MKILGIILAVILSIGSFQTAGYAKPIDLGIALDKLDLKQGVAYSIIDGRANYISTMEVAEYKSFTIELGYAGVAKETGHKAVIVLSYPLYKVSEEVTLPILDSLEGNLGIYGGFGRLDFDEGTGNNEFDLGFSLTVLEVKF